MKTSKKNRHNFIKYSAGCVFFVLISVGTLSGCALQTAGGFYQDALKEVSSSNYTQAATHFEAAIDKNAERAEYYLDYADMKIETGEYEEAIGLFDKVIMDKDIGMVRANNKLAYRGKGIAYFMMGKLEQALADFERALEIEENPEINTDILAYTGSIHAKRGDYRAAVAAYDEILRHEEGNAAVYRARAYAYLNIGGIQMSRDDYDKAIELEPDNIDAYLGKYALMVKLGDEIGATAVLKQAADIPANTAEEQFAHAKILFYLGDERAEELLVSSATEGYPQAYFYLGEMAIQAGEYEDALFHYNRYAEKSELVNGALYNQMALCHIALEQYNEALDCVRKGLRIGTDEQVAALLRNEIAVYEKLGEYEKAYQKALAYLEEYPADAQMQREYLFLTSRVPEDERVELEVDGSGSSEQMETGGSEGSEVQGQ